MKFKSVLLLVGILVCFIVSFSDGFDVPFSLVTKPIEDPNKLATRQNQITCSRPVAKNKHQDAFAMLMLVAVEFAAFFMHYFLQERKWRFFQVQFIY